MKKQDWSIQFLSTREELRKRGFIKEIEWMEIHQIRMSQIRLVKKHRKESHYYYVNICYGRDFQNWADAHYMNFNNIKKNEIGNYQSQDLDVLVEFVGEIKANAL